MGRTVYAFQINVGAGASTPQDIFTNDKDHPSIVKKVFLDFPDANNLNLSVHFEIGTVQVLPTSGEFKTYGGKIYSEPELSVPPNSTLKIVVSNSDTVNAYTIVGFIEVEQ